LNEGTEELHALSKDVAGIVEQPEQSGDEEGWARELSAGVCTFINSQSDPFTCIFKHRFSDFIVNEIDQTGEVLKLTTVRPVLLGAPGNGNETATKESTAAAPAGGAVASSSAESDAETDWQPITSEMVEHMEKEGGSSEEVKNLIDFAQRVVSALKSGAFALSETKKRSDGAQKAVSESGETTLTEDDQLRQLGIQLKKEEIFLSCEGKSKGWRGEFHGKIRKLFPNLRSETVMKDKVSYMKIWYGKDKYDRRDEKKSRQVARYLKCVMKKENKDSTDAIHVLTRFLGFKTGQIRFAGTKDKRGVTTQALTMPFIDPLQASRVNSKLISSNMRIGNFSATNDNLGLGSLKGNQFRVILRNIQLAPHLSYPGKSSSDSTSKMATEFNDAQTVAALSAVCEKFAETGFINYYGMQRFGTGAVRTHEVGLECLRGNWQQVVQAILKPRGGEREDAARARTLFETTGNAAETLKIMPKFMLNERFILAALAESPKDYKGAFHRLARPMRLMYPHAYQSYIWNMAASKRIELFGYKVVVGDLVMLNIDSLSERLDEEILQGTDAVETANSSVAPQSDSHTTTKVQSEPRKRDQNKDATGASRPRPVHWPGDESPLGPIENGMLKIIQTEEEAAQYTMDQVVLPLPGSLVCLPDNEVGVYIESLLEKDGLSMHFESDREFHLSGDYRPLIVKPKDFNFNILRYRDQDGLLQPTEEDALLEELGQAKQVLATISESSLASIDPSSSSSSNEATIGNESGDKAPLVALQLTFSLQSSSYASMLVRELVKQPLDQSFLRDKFSTTSAPTQQKSTTDKGVSESSSSMDLS
jgi:tRNA pseudouridine13 synthase